MQLVCKVWEHESREALRIADTLHAPLHPHNTDGMLAYGDPEGDLTFGAAG